MANKITVTSLGTTANVNATPDSARYYSDKSKEWAISDKLIDNTDYSSKYYANESKKQADISTAKTTEVIESGNTAVTNIDNARDNAIIDITNQENLSVDNVNTAGATQISSVNTAGITQVANVNSAGTTQINLAKEQVTLATNQANIATEQATIATNKASEVVTSGNEALSNIDTAKTGAITDITNLKNTSISDINTTKDNAITTITTQETISKNNIITTGNEQVERVNLTGVDNRTPIFSKNEIGTNEGVYKNVYDLKHSTFDLSKFTVVGSPTITDDGVASGFSNEKHLRTIQLSALKGKSWSIIGEWINLGNADNENKPFINFGYDYPQNGCVYVKYADNFYHVGLRIKTGTTDDTMTGATVIYSSRYDLLDKVLVKVSFNIDTGVYSLDINMDGSWVHCGDYTAITTNKELYAINVHPTKYVQIGFGRSGSNFYSLNATDLKQFSITVDGKEVFSGNKTGLDVIKPDNYEVVGSPVISDDGVASGFSSSNYLTIPKLSTLVGSADSWELDMQFTTPSDITSSRVGWLLEGNTDWCNLIRVGGDGANYTGIEVCLTSTGNSYNIASYKHVVHVTANTTYWLKLIFTGTEYLCKYSTNGTDFTTVNIATSSLKISDNSTLLNIGVSKNATNSFRGSIDLNAFKIYVDGDIVYQPCLKIPYTQSKTGSKIVDVAYRDRVIDLYEQEGQAGYYTIDEENKNFTLPMGEIYGMIGQRSLISSTVTETNRVDIYSDKTCLICGNVATAGTINLPIELVNNNYFITLPTSAKTATSFTTTSTGDYILIGKVA